ncbi:MAG: 2'-5' RNA ligase [Lachnospiraceae bacterium]|nr:2'-5' RNA ligase [Lachnospiraceae bacterium]
MYNAYITRIKNLRKHSNADRLQCGECFGNTVVVSLDYVDNQLGVYFPTDGQLSVEFAEKNNLLRKKDENGNNIGGYMDPDKRNVTTIRLRGEKSDGLFLPITSLEAFGDISKLAEGDIINVFNGHEICKKYIPKTTKRTGHPTDGNRTRKKKDPIAPLFAEHADTEQLAYNLGAFKPGDEIEITLKMHGTSQRTGYLPRLTGYKRTLLDRILRRPGKPIYEYGYVSGTRRVVLGDFDGEGFYGSNAFREQHAKKFEGKLMKGETVYYEVVGFTDTGAPIMGNCENKKLNDKDFIKQYGETTCFSYGCAPTGKQVMINENASITDRDFAVEFDVPVSDCYVYRMTMTNEDGFVVEYTPDFMRYRCEQMGIKTVPVFYKGILPSEEEVKVLEESGLTMPTASDIILNAAEKFYDGPDPIGQTHVREGVVVRILNRPKFCAYKHKNFAFKCLSGIAVDNIDPNSVSEDILAEM